MPKISVITPVYNSERYLAQCLDSLLSQTFKNMEFILVDDGSTDSSGAICDSYAQKDNRVVVIHKENAGMGVSYNIGMDRARGEYIGFLESDDFADIHMYEDLIAFAEEYKDCDIIKSNWYEYYTSENRANVSFQFDLFENIREIDIREYSYILQRQFSVWSAIYKADFLRKYNIRFLETPGASYQDVGFTYKAFCFSKKMFLTPATYVYYRKDNETSSINSREKIEAIFWEYREVDKFLETHPEIKKWVNTDKLLKQYIDYKWNCNRIAPDLRSAFMNHFKNDFREYIGTGELGADFVRCVNPREFDAIMNYPV